MRTTIRLNDQLLQSAKRLAHDTERSLSSVIEDALCQKLGRRPAMEQSRKPVKLTTVSGHGLRPGIDLNNSAALLTVKN